MSALIKPVNRELELAFLDCHSNGHQWRHEGGKLDPSEAEPGMRAPYGMTAVGRRSVCNACACERIRWYARSGEVFNRYRYADGYLHKRTTPDDFAPSRLEWRQSFVVRLFGDEPTTTKRKRRSAAA